MWILDRTPVTGPRTSLYDGRGWYKKGQKSPEAERMEEFLKNPPKLTLVSL